VTSLEGRGATRLGYDAAAEPSFLAVSAIYQHPLDQRDELAWIDLRATGAVPTGEQLDQNGNPVPLDQAIPSAMALARGSGWDVIAREGDERGAVWPDWSHDGTRIAYTSANETLDGYGRGTESDIFIVPFNGGSGGAVTPVAGASDPAFVEYSADHSADDRYLSFNRVAPEPVSSTFANPNAEVFAVPSSGGQPVRLAANDPPACSGESSPGVGNTWPRWSPRVTEVEGRRYYFLVFSSRRQSPFAISGNPNGAFRLAPQLYLASLVENADGSVESYPAIFLHGQTAIAEAGETTAFSRAGVMPVWDDVVLAPAP
jgi:hypothetical protein